MTQIDWRSEWALSYLIHPLSIDDFASTIWETRPLHVKRDDNPALHNYIDRFASLDTIDEWLTSIYVWRPDAVRMSRNGLVLPASQYTTNGHGSGVDVDIDRVVELYRTGASLILNGVQAVSPEIAMLSANLADVLGVKVHANAYVTPSQAQGFPLHSDGHDVFVVQLSGEKDWTIHSTDATSLQRESFVPFAGDPVTAGPVRHLRLEPGDVLYLPRGTLHEAVSTETTSFHLSIGVTSYTWGDLVRGLIAEIEEEDIDMRRSVGLRPHALTSSDLAIGRRMLDKLTSRLADDKRIRSIGEHTVNANKSLRGSHAFRRGEFSNAVNAGGVTATTMVKLKSEIPPQITLENGRVHLQFGARILTLPNYAESHVRLLCNGRSVCAAELPPDIDDAGRLVLVRRLVLEGLLGVTSD